MKRIMFFAVGSVCLLLSGCTIVQTGKAVSVVDLTSREMCVVENPDVNASFLPAYKAALEKKGLSVKVLKAGSDVASCPLSSTYVGKWSWDFKPYMATAEIVVYRQGARAGEAIYKAPRAGFAMTTKIYETTESKIENMVDQLFPQSVGSK